MKGAFVLFLLFSASSTSFGQVDESAPAMMLPSPEKRLRFSRVVIMHNDRPNRHIRFMFEPLVRTRAIVELPTEVDQPVWYTIEYT